MPLAAEAGDALGGVQQQLGGGTADGEDHPGADGKDLLLEVVAAGAGLLGRGGPVVGRAALDDVGDVHRVPGQAHRGDLFVEQFAGPPDEGPTGAILVGPRALADDHECGIGVTLAEDGLPPALVQVAAGAALDLVLVELLEGVPLLIGGSVGGNARHGGRGGGPGRRGPISLAVRAGGRGRPTGRGIGRVPRGRRVAIALALCRRGRPNEGHGVDAQQPIGLQVLSEDAQPTPGVDAGVGGSRSRGFHTRSA